MVWQNFQNLQVRRSVPSSRKRRYSVTADILSYQNCSIQYGTFAVRKYEPALTVQLFYGTIIHEVLDRAHAHFRGVIGPQVRGSFPTDQDIEEYFLEVENSLRARRIQAVSQIRDQALEVIKRFNRLEGPVLYPRIFDTECHLQADQGSYILHGNVDVLANDPNQPEVVEIWDYKGSKKPSIGEPTYEKHVFQMQVYAELYRRRTGQVPQRAILYYLNELSGPMPPQTRPVNALLEVTFKQISVNMAMNSFNSTVQAIELGRSTNNWPDPDPNKPPTEETCDACDLRWNCKAANKLGRKYEMRYP
jgi:hypothetical protein